MAASDRPASADRGPDRSLNRRLPGDPADVTLLVAGVALLALVVRLVLLGDRIAHWDEGRVAYWIVHYQETGAFAYRRIIHGPFVQHVNRWLFELVGANDFTMRLPVALVSVLLPLSALLFREHLRRVEMVAMALFLSFNPVVLYYSRFMRSDLLVATFMFVGFGFFVRFWDTRQVRYVLAASAFVACGFASKENAAVYVLTWIGALGLLADQALYRPREYVSGSALLVEKGHRAYDERLAPWLGATRTLSRYGADRISGGNPASDDEDADEDDATTGGRAARAGRRSTPTSAEVREALATFVAPFRYVVYVAAAAFVFVALSLFFYAPRGAGMEGITHPPAETAESVVGFWQGFTSPSAFVAMVEHTWTHASEEFGTWFGRATEGGDEGLASVYVEFLGSFVRVMATKAAPLTAFAIFGFVIERYGVRRSRNLVMFAAYGGFVSVLGYPLGTDIFGAWLVVHALVPLSIPAAVGLARVYDWGYDAFVDDDAVGVGVAALVVLLVAGQVAAVAAPSVYTNDQAEDNYLVQYAQPGGDPRPELETMAAIGGANDSGVDVLLYYGEQGGSYDDNSAFVEEDPSAWDSARYDLYPLCANWYNTLPLPWYFAQSDASVTCERDESDLAEQVGSDPPPMIITQDADATVPADELEAAYDGTSYEMRTYGTDATFWVREDLAEESA